MDWLTGLQIVVSSVAGLAMCLGALVILHGIDLRRGGHVMGICWAVVAFAGAWMGLVAGVLWTPPPLSTMVVEVAMAWLVWANMDALACRASCGHRRAHRVEIVPGAPREAGERRASMGGT